MSSIVENSETQKLIELLCKALDTSHDGFAIWQALREANGEIVDFRLLFINQAGAAPTGVSAEELSGSLMQTIIPETEAPRLQKIFIEALETHSPQTETIHVRSLAGWVGAYENTVVPLTDSEILATFRDVSKEQAEAHRLKWLNDHDALTGLANRNFLERIIEEALDQIENFGEVFTFGFIDIDDFKKINDTYGHTIGDQVLIEFGKNIQYVLHGRDRLARLSGDEFAVLLYGVKAPEQLSSLYERLQKVASEGIAIDSKLVKISFSCGFYLIDNPNTTISQIFSEADQAMYEVKRNGKNGYKFIQK